ncbi:MAG TPA: hypothetical protein VF766_09680 [Pyrinomonadaceae bacterium]
MNINLHIERLVLDEGVMTLGQRRLLQATVQAELIRLLTTGGLSSELAAGGAVPSVQGKAIELGNNVGPIDLGRQIAGSVYAGIGK